MNILLIYRYFWPEAPHLGDMELAIAETLVEDGHDVVVLTSSSTHIGKRYANRQPRRSSIRGVEIYRVRLPEERRGVLVSRLLNEVLFQAQLVMFILRNARRFDAIYANTTPPFSCGVVAALSRKVFGTPYVHHVWDIHPEMDAYAGKLSRGRIFHLLRAIDSWVCRTSSLTITLSTDMALELESRGNVGNVAVIANFAAGTECHEKQNRDTKEGPYTVVFTGNLGKYQGLDAVIEAAALLQDLDVRIDFYGSGSEKSRLQSVASQSGTTNIRFHDHVSLDKVMEVLSQTDLALLPLAPSMHRVAHPSKLPIYLQAGCRILTIVEEESDLAQLTLDTRIGTVAEPGNPTSIAAAIRQEMARSLSGETYTTDRFDRATQLSRWQEVFRSLGRVWTKPSP